MTTKHTILTAIAGLRTNRSRSALTILGIVIGITAIMVVMSLGQGAQNLIVAQIQGLGSRTIVVLPGREPRGPAEFAQLFSESLKERDIEALQKKSNVPHLTKIMPIVFGVEPIAHAGETYRPTILGVTELALDIYDIQPSQGRMFTDDEVRERAVVIVLGEKVARELFGFHPALNGKVRIKSTNFKVIGLLPKTGQISFINFDEVALLPYTSAQQFVFGIKFFHRIALEADSDTNVVPTVTDVVRTLRESHRITDPAKDDFYIQTPTDIAERLSVVTGVMTLFLAAVAAISLVVGGIGIMNIMLVAVTERTREIGLRKALGATNTDILRQFLFESVMLTVTGGAIGVMIGTFLSFASSLALSRFAGLPWTFVFPMKAAFMGLAVSGVVGLAFGLYPARKAALKHPIEALRYE